MSAHFSFSHFSSYHLYLLVVFALFRFCLSNENFYHVLCMDGERQALLRFKHGLIDEARRITFWVGEERDCCKWVGITCDNSTGHVRRIHLPGPHDHCDFQDPGTPKEYEEASKQRLKGGISLRRLHHLDMSGIDLSKVTKWSEVINTLHSLVQLHLSNCKLSNIHPHVLGLNLTSLSILDLSFNDFNSSMPSWIFSVTNLVSLDLRGCSIHGIIPNSIYSFRNLTSLKFLYISGYDFMNSPLVLKELSSSNLISLDMSSCGVSSLLLDSLHNLTSLLSLDLSYNQLTKKIPKSLGNLCDLRDINLSGNYFVTGIIASSVVFQWYKRNTRS
ncbi:hypothetical protein L1987_30754 [Smallanthus sonchifolius]|uniref:Uncharacterized protein n=1 Tax=Smallanthus sonchifolius TaxID=185202 RepID=A0ACB9I330_9ASTR|nr:hypothetical protein L1987_30754 [Smallanthus sonchifolius]